MKHQKRNMVSTTEKGYREAALSVLKNLCFAGEVQEEIQFSCTHPQKSSLRRSFAGLEALIRTFFVIYSNYKLCQQAMTQR